MWRQLFIPYVYWSGNNSVIVNKIKNHFCTSHLVKYLQNKGRYGEHLLASTFSVQWYTLQCGKNIILGFKITQTYASTKPSNLFYNCLEYI